MPPYTKQHWLPAGYMKFFAIDGKVEGRNSEVYFTNTAECKVEKVKNLSYADFHYSEEDAEGAEKSFHLMENDYPRIIDKILANEPLKTKEYYGLIVTMIDFHARNASYKNLTDEENYKAFETVSKELLKLVFKDCTGWENDLGIISKFLKDNWEFQPVCSPKEELFSSDHPTLIFSIDDDLGFLFLPINPHYGIIAVDKRKVKITGKKINDADNGMLNAYQAYHCIEFVYSNIDLTEMLGDGKPLDTWLNKDKPRGFVKKDCWRPEFISYPNNMPSEFSFIEVIKQEVDE